MKIFKKLALNTDFFNRYISLINDTAIIKTITQVVSAVTAIAIWYALAENNLKPILGWWAVFPSAFFAVVVAISIEIGLRKFLPYGVRCFIKKRWTGLDGAMSAFILPICCALLVASGWTSFVGSYSVVEVVTPDLELKSTTLTDSTYIAQISDNKNTFSGDSLMIASSFNTQIEAVQNRYITLVNAYIKQAEKYKKRANRAKGRSNKNWLLVLSDRELNKSDIAESKKDSVIAELEATKAKKLFDLIDNRRIDKIIADTTYKATTNKIIASNDALLVENKNLIESYGTGLGWITIVCLLVFIALTILEEIHAKGSNIEETVIYNQYDVLPPIWQRWTNYINELYLGFCHRKLDKWESNLIPPKMPKKIPPIYYLGEQEQERIELKTDSSPTKEVAPGTSENDWNIILGEEFKEEKKGFENGFSLNRFVNRTGALFESTLEEADTKIIKLDNGKKEEGKRIEIKGFLREEVSENINEKNPIKRIKIGHRVDILDLNKLNKRDKEKFKAKQKKRIIRYYKSYLKKKGKKPSYSTISDALNISVTTIGKYIRELKLQGEI